MDALTRDPEVAPPRSRARRRAVTALLVLVTAAIGAGIWYWPVKAPGSKWTRAQTAGQPIPVIAAAAVTRDMPIWLDGLGTVQAFQTVTVKSMVDGSLISVNFKEGQEVHAGEVLARIDPRIYQAALDSARARKALDEANLANARLDLARYRKLAATNYTTQQQADTQKAQVEQLEAQVRVDEAQIDTAATQLSYTTITSPLNGRVGLRLVDKGNIVHAADTTGIVVVTQLKPISVVFSLPQQALPRVAAALARGGPVPVVAFTEGTGMVADTSSQPLDHGTLTVLDNQIDPTTGTIRLKATFPNKTESLWPGGFVGVRLRVDTVRGATVVPPAALQRGPAGDFVYRIDAHDVARLVPVTAGYQDQDGAIVTHGLTPGDRVVIDGASRLTDGAKVVLVPAAAAPPVPSIRRATAPGTRPRGQMPADGG
jgi:membrane fusion protein, multidrug efflux system